MFAGTGIQGQMFICENIQTSSITWTEHVIFRTMNTCMHVITFGEKKDAMNLKENGEKNMWRFGERKGKTEMLKIKMQFQKKVFKCKHFLFIFLFGEKIH